jgi:hypothetical protein
MLDVNATAPTLKGMGETKVVSGVGGGTMGGEVFLPPFGTVDLSSVWQSVGVSPTQHPFPSRVFGRRNLNHQID